MTRIYPIRTGLVRVRRAQMESRGKGLTRMANMLFDEEWTDWLPIYCWVIDHDRGIILVDAGETARVHERGYHPAWHPFYRRAAQFSVHPEEEIGPQLHARGIKSRDIRHVVLTHLHTDHAGGLAHLAGCRTWVAQQEFESASGIMGKVMGYLPHRWPKWWNPEFIRFDGPSVGPFPHSMSLTDSGDVLVIPTPGHTPHHVSVLVSGSPSYLIAGDTSYNQKLLLAGKIDGVSPSEAVARTTHENILALTKEQPLIYLPSHDPENEERLSLKTLLNPEARYRAGAAVSSRH